MELVMYMDALLSLRERSGQQAGLQYVRGHVGEVGNEGADALAVRGATLPEVEERDWVTLRLRLLDEEPEPKLGAIADTELVDASISVSHPLILCHIERSLRKHRVGRCTRTCYSMKMIFLQNLRKTRCIYVAFLIYCILVHIPCCRAQERRCAIARLPSASLASSQPNGSLQIRGFG